MKNTSNVEPNTLVYAGYSYCNSKVKYCCSTTGMLHYYNQNKKMQGMPCQCCKGKK